MQVVRLRGIEQFEGEIENFILNTFINFKPVKRFKNWSGVGKFWSFDESTRKGVLDLLETICLGLWKTVVKRVTVVKFGMDDGYHCNKFIVRRMRQTFLNVFVHVERNARSRQAAVSYKKSELMLMRRATASV